MSSGYIKGNNIISEQIHVAYQSCRYINKSWKKIQENRMANPSKLCPFDAYKICKTNTAPLRHFLITCPYLHLGLALVGMAKRAGVITVDIASSTKINVFY